jgi:phytoene synthase
MRRQYDEQDSSVGGASPAAPADSSSLPSSPGRGHDARPTDPVGECAALVRRHDRDRYFAALLAPRDGRAALLALHAFNQEIARVREAVSEPLLGRIRLQWWREALDGIDGGGPVRRHAVALALADAVRRHDLDRTLLDRMIDGREFDLEDRQPATMNELLGYADSTSGTLSMLAMAALGGRSEDAQRAAREAGIAWALAGLLRAVPFHAAQRRIYLPLSGLDDDTARRSLFAGRGGEMLSRAVGAVAEHARDHLMVSRRLRRAVPRSARAAVVHCVLIDADLAALRRAGNDVFSIRVAPPIIRQGRMIAAALCGGY